MAVVSAHLRRRRLCLELLRLEGNRAARVRRDRLSQAHAVPLPVDGRRLFSTTPGILELPQYRQAPVSKRRLPAGNAVEGESMIREIEFRATIAPIMSG